MGSYMACALALDDRGVHKVVINPSMLLPPQLPGVTAPATPAPGTVAAAVHELTPSRDNARDILTLVLKNPAALTGELVELFCENWNEKNQAANRGRLPLSPPKPIAGQLPLLRNPALLLWGAQDRERAVLMQRLIEAASCMCCPPADTGRKSIGAIALGKS